MQSQPRPGEPAGQRLAGASPLKRRLSKFATNKLVNPAVRRLIESGVFPRTHALLETNGNKTGLPRRVPVGNGLRGDTFWIVTGHGNAAGYVKNIRHDPAVRIKVGRRWCSGTAQVLPEDDARERLRQLGRPVNDGMLRLVGTEMLVVRLDLDDADRNPMAELKVTLSTCPAAPRLLPAALARGDLPSEGRSRRTDLGGVRVTAREGHGRMASEASAGALRSEDP